MGSIIAIIVLLVIAIYALPVVVPIILVAAIYKIIANAKYKKLEKQVLSELGFLNWEMVSYFDECVIVKSRSTLEKYDDIKFFKENKEKLEKAEKIIKRKNEVEKISIQKKKKEEEEEEIKKV